MLDEKALKKGGYGGILGVGQGSANPPRLVRLDYRHPKATKHLALVGKGITFDSGRPLDQAGGRHGGDEVRHGRRRGRARAMAAIAQLGLPVNVTGWLAIAENMPSGTAQRPSDVLTMYGGQTVEVLNTDAEGRLVLADALVAAAEDKPDVIVDVATLTGAQVVALGTRVSGIMANDDTLRDQVHDAAGRAGEQMWPMPLPEELRKGLDSPVADIATTSATWGPERAACSWRGCSCAGLRRRTGEQPWAHLDIAGPAFNTEQPYGYTPKGGTAVGVRTMLALAEDLAGRRRLIRRSADA